MVWSTLALSMDTAAKSLCLTEETSSTPLTPAPFSQTVERV